MRTGVVLLLVMSGFSTQAERLVLDQAAITDGELELAARRLHEKASGCAQSLEEQRGRAEGLDKHVERLLAAQVKEKDAALYGAFAEVKAKDDKDIDFAQRYFDPIRVLAQAYALPESRHFHSPEVASAIELGFVFTRKHVHSGCEKPGNWWVWGKQMPTCLSELLALLHGHIASDDKVYLVSILDYLLGKGPIPGAGHHTGKTGMDALNGLTVGVLSADRQRIAYAWEAMENELSPYLAEPDGTPLGSIVRSPFLGIELPYMYEGFGTLVEWTRITHGTHMALRDETLGFISDYLLGLGRWNTYQGREVAWISFISYRVFWGAQAQGLAGQLAAFPVPRADELKAMAEGSDAPPLGIRFWPSAETLIWRTPGQYCALVMASKNKHKVSWVYKNYHQNIGNNWYYGRDGHLVVARRSEDADANLTYWQDWQRLTGITHDDGSVLDSPKRVVEDHGYWVPAYLYCENPVAGAAVLEGREAAAGIAVVSGEIRARKSYFFLRDHTMLAQIGSHIRGRGATESIVHTFRVHEDERTLVVNGVRKTLTEGAPVTLKTPAWVYGAGGGYYFPEESTVRALTVTREPDFTNIGSQPTSAQLDVPSQAFISILFDHGADPVDAAYAVVYLPQAKVEDMPALARTIQRNATWGSDDAGHYFDYETYRGRTFYQPGEVQGISANRPCMLAMRVANGKAAIALYEPSWQTCSLSIGLPFGVNGADAPGIEEIPHGFRAAIRPGQPFEFAVSVRE